MSIWHDNIIAATVIYHLYDIKHPAFHRLRLLNRTWYVTYKYIIGCIDSINYKIARYCIRNACTHWFKFNRRVWFHCIKQRVKYNYFKDMEFSDGDYHEIIEYVAKFNAIKVFVEHLAMKTGYDRNRICTIQRFMERSRYYLLQLFATPMEIYRNLESMDMRDDADCDMEERHMIIDFCINYRHDGHVYHALTNARVLNSEVWIYYLKQMHKQKN
jgi:hypothetical protein